MGEGLKDFWVPLPLGVKLLGGLLAWKKVSPAPALFANPSHLPWLALGGTSTFDLFAKLPVSTETKEGLEGAQALPSGDRGPDPSFQPLPHCPQMPGWLCPWNNIRGARQKGGRAAGDMCGVHFLGHGPILFLLGTPRAEPCTGAVLGA